MGKNSKARREAKAKARRREHQTKLGAGVARGSYGPSPDLTTITDDVALSSMFRRSCSECGSDDLSWMSPGELIQNAPEEQRSRIQEGIDLVGADGDAWLCGQCGNFGLMSRASSSF